MSIMSTIIIPTPCNLFFIVIWFGSKWMSVCVRLNEWSVRSGFMVRHSDDGVPCRLVVYQWAERRKCHWENVRGICFITSIKWNHQNCKKTQLAAFVFLFSFCYIMSITWWIMNFDSLICHFNFLTNIEGCQVTSFFNVIVLPSTCK